MKAFNLMVMLIGVTQAQEEDTSPYALPFELPEWLVPDDNGGKLPFLPSDQLSVVECPQKVQSTSYCDLPGDSEGVFVCRRVGLVNLNVCTPNVMTSNGTTVLGVEGDSCGCCEGSCPETCSCECNEGRGVMIETYVIRWWHVRLCVPRLVADYMAPLRKEVRCGTTCLLK